MPRLPRCPRCRWIQEICACVDAPGLELRTRVTIVSHILERKIASNTGNLLKVALRNVGEGVRGVRNQPVDAAAVTPPGYRPILLYRDRTAPVLSAAALAAVDPERAHLPLNLLVIDANWGQSKSFRAREAALRDIPCFILPPGPPSRYRLRKEPDEQSVSTYEAVARALGVIEGHEVQRELEAFFDRVIGRTLARRGISAE